MNVWVGTSGYSHRDWAGSFYPAGTRPYRMLAYHPRHFPLVELNFTFYRPTTPEMLGRIADAGLGDLIWEAAILPGRRRPALQRAGPGAILPLP
jgi:uncharacterized protein YecE (DUF72 family)